MIEVQVCLRVQSLGENMSRSLTFHLTRIVLVGLIASAGLVSMASSTERRIRFERGRTSKPSRAASPTGGRICYVAGARRGQLLEAYVVLRLARSCSSKKRTQRSFRTSGGYGRPIRLCR